MIAQIRMVNVAAIAHPGMALVVEGVQLVLQGHGRYRVQQAQRTLVNPVTYVPLLLDRINQRTGLSNSV
jgi:hypothetical protein